MDDADDEKDANEKVMKMDVNEMEKKDVVFLTFLANYGSKAINKNDKKKKNPI